MKLRQNFFHDLIIKIKDFLDKNFSHKPRLILGLSGGADSVFLLHLLNELKVQGKIDLVAAHLNHGWRERSGEDEKFCQNLCNELAVKLEVGFASQFNHYKLDGSWEDLGHKMRNSFFESLRQRYSADLIALAHHLDDQIETFLIKTIRGAGLEGLACMKIYDGNTKKFRPLLEASKSDIECWLKSKNFSFCLDESNFDDKYLRNRIRKHLLPNFYKVDERIKNSFKRNFALWREESLLLHDLLLDRFSCIFQYDNGIWQGDLKKFKLLKNNLQQRLIIMFFRKNKITIHQSRSFVQEIVRFLTQSSKSKVHKIGLSFNLQKEKGYFFIKQ